MLRYFAVVVGLAAISMLSLGCGRQAEKQPAGSGAPSQVSSPEQTTAPNVPPPPPPGREGAADSQPMNAAPDLPPAAPTASSVTGDPASPSQSSGESDGNEEVRPGRVAGALFRALRSSVPIPGNLGGASDAASQNGEEAPRFRP